MGKQVGLEQHGHGFDCVYTSSFARKFVTEYFIHSFIQSVSKSASQFYFQQPVAVYVQTVSPQL